MTGVQVPVRDFSLRQIFTCGQCFRWEAQPDGAYVGIAGPHVARLSVQPAGDAAGSAGILTVTPCDDASFAQFWRSYLDLDRDYGQIKAALSAGDPVMADAVAFGSGIRILRQELWETLVSFLISQNNHIPRIRGCIEALARQFGRPAATLDGRRWYALPGPSVLASLTEDDLAPVRLGYRARYLIGMARAVAERGLPADREALLALPGVGPKVAACVELFAMGRHAAFPVDVWIARGMQQLYGFAPGNRAGMEAYARERFGDLGGFAQQYLFYYLRETGGAATGDAAADFAEKNRKIL